ncbi:MAG: aminopeptidase P family protein [Armatimonadetes bacterium]|nr:aminopeptidase P family protein [Armatimonadota bacterium]
MISPRVELAREKLTENELQGFIVSDRQNIRWLTGFTGSSGVALLTCDSVHLFTDSRYTIQASQEAPGAVVHISSEPPIKQVAEKVSTLGCEAVGFESTVVTVEEYRQLEDGAADVRLVGLAQALSPLRAVKDTEEIERLRKACEITDAAFSAIQPFLKPGTKELDILRELVYILTGLGAEKESFDSIVASGPRSALPHAHPTDRILAAGEPVLLDFGAQYQGYAGDITRTLFLGSATDEFRKVYQTVLDAQMAAIAAIRPGVPGKDVDEVARKIITDAGYGNSFGHGLGHQLGLSVHDGPALSPKSDIVLLEGMVVTVEPGIYIEGWGGVRIEDDVLVGRCGAEVLTVSQKSLTELAV